jgi:hypothetical protein
MNNKNTDTLHNNYTPNKIYEIYFHAINKIIKNQFKAWDIEIPYSKNNSDASHRDILIIKYYRIDFKCGETRYFLTEEIRKGNHGGGLFKRNCFIFKNTKMSKNNCKILIEVNKPYSLNFENFKEYLSYISLEEFDKLEEEQSYSEIPNGNLEKQKTMKIEKLYKDRKENVQRYTDSYYYYFKINNNIKEFRIHQKHIRWGNRYSYYITNVNSFKDYECFNDIYDIKLEELNDLLKSGGCSFRLTEKVKVV